jgi:hypothetical protein
LAKEEVRHDVWKVIGLVSFYQSSVILSMSYKPFFLCHVSVIYLCHVDKLSIYVMWTSCLSMSCGQVVYLFHVDKLFFYVMCTNYLSFISINYLSISCTQLVAVI